ncbi:DUF4129 domain-containing protein [Proteobacteria bacterium 005FR1]|nr:DUF4129 domain-containing protein [Proteobacteria bacterium 005FR1]
MDLSKLKFDPRLRNGWQAIDLGFAMARQWWWPSFLVWMIPALALYALLSFLLVDALFLLPIIIWWLKPLWDRLPLMMGSRALFGEALNVAATLRQSPKIFWIDLLPSLTWRRFSPTRSFDLPVTALEGLRGEERSRRLAVLHQNYSNAASWLTVVLVHVEGFLGLGFWSMAALFIPPELNVSWFALASSDGTLVMHFSNLITFAAMALVAPFYTLAGFALYICRRVQLEGWDIEIRFRHLVEKHQQPEKLAPGRKVAAWLLPLTVCMGLWGQTGDSWAQQVANQSSLIEDYYRQLDNHAPAAESKQQVMEVLGGEDFHRIEMEQGWRLKRAGEGEAGAESMPEWLLWFADVIDWLQTIASPLRDIFGGFATGFQLLLWIVVIALVAWLLYRYRNGLISLLSLPAKRKTAAQPDVLFGLDIRKESIPEDVCKRVRQWWSEGRHRDALGLLYRATLSRLVHQFAFEFHAGYTEQECVAVVSRGDNRDLSDYVSRLTRSWQQLAYAHRLPEAAQVDALCSQWQGLFGELRDAR